MEHFPVHSQSLGWRQWSKSLFCRMNVGDHFPFLINIDFFASPMGSWWASDCPIRFLNISIICLIWRLYLMFNTAISDFIFAFTSVSNVYQPYFTLLPFKISTLFQSCYLLWHLSVTYMCWTYAFYRSTKQVVLITALFSSLHSIFIASSASTVKLYIIHY